MPDAVLPNTADRAALGPSLARLIGAVTEPEALSAFDV